MAAADREGQGRGEVVVEYTVKDLFENIDAKVTTGLAEIKTILSGKADRADVDRVERAMGGKADQREVDTALALGKANEARITTIEKQLARFVGIAAGVGAVVGGAVAGVARLLP